jgi:hypothetical protein
VGVLLPLSTYFGRINPQFFGVSYIYFFVSGTGIPAFTNITGRYLQLIETKKWNKWGGKKRSVKYAPNFGFKMNPNRRKNTLYLGSGLYFQRHIKFSDTSDYLNRIK